MLSAKGALDAELRAYVRERVAESGLEVMELGMKRAGELHAMKLRESQQ